MVQWLLTFALIMAVISITSPCSQALHITNELKTKTFLSPLFTLKPGSVVEKYYYNIDFPKGHIAFKGFDAEVVDESGNPMPLYETYLHHWGLFRYYQYKDAPDPDNVPLSSILGPDYIAAGNNGTCTNNVLLQYYGIGSETRKTSTFVPDPYGIEIGNPAKVPMEYSERWLLNVHAIDIRGVENKLGCTECWCHLYNVTKDQFGMPIKPDYKGGLRCCYDKTQCRVADQSYDGNQIRLYMRYTVKWVDWDDDSVLPVKVYMFDVTDNWKPLTDSKTHYSEERRCSVEYSVESCTDTNKNSSECNATKRASVSIPNGGYLIYGVAHQHAGGIGSTLTGEDGRVLCSSLPTYGDGNEVGNENGYIVGMSSCYPKAGSVKISKGEIMSFESKYAPTESHTGVMGVFQIMVAEKLPKPSLDMEASSKLVDEAKYY